MYDLPTIFSSDVHFVLTTVNAFIQDMVYIREVQSYAPFTPVINVTVFASGTFDIFNVMCKQHHRTALNPFLKRKKTVTLTARVNEALISQFNYLKRVASVS